PFEHEARLKELLVRQAELNAALDLDKGERQVAPPAGDESVAEGNGGAGADERAAGMASHADRPGAPPRYDPTGPSNETSIRTADRNASVRRPPSVPGREF